MKTRLVIAVTLLAVAASSHADERKFSAADLPSSIHLRKGGKIVISNNARSITAWQFFGNIREALVTLRSTRLALHATPYGNVLFNADAPVTTVPPQLAGVIADAARTHGVDPRLVAAVARRESAFNPVAVSRTGACGLMQLMPSTARYLGVRNVFDVRENVFGGARYLRTLLDTFDGDLDLTLAAYNAGPGAVQRFNGVPPYRETQAYVAAVKAHYEAAVRGEGRR